MEIKTNGFKLPSGDIHVFIPPEPTETDRGGIKASEKTTESLEVKYDKKTGKLFSPTSPTDNTLTKSNVAADAKKTGDEFARVNNNMESKLDKQQGVENAGKAMVINPEGLIVPGEVTGGDGIPIINTMSGESPLVISDSAERINKGFSIIGNTEQLTTTGANLFDEKKLLNFDDPNYDKSSAGKGVFYYKFKTDEQVTVSVTKLNKDGEYLCVGAEPGGSDAYWLSHKSAATNTFKTLTPKDGYIYLGVNTTLEGVENMIRKTGGIMINHGSVAMPYEPYTGGKPSPSPEYPQEIKNVGKWNPETQKYEVDIRITNAKESWDKEQTLTLTSDRPITKWDKLVEKDGEIGWLHATKELDLSTLVYWESGGSFVTQLIDSVIGVNTSFCDKIKNLGTVLISDPQYANAFCVYVDNANINYKYFRPPNESITNIGSFIEWLKENKHKFIYHSKETEFAPLPQEEQDAIRALKTYYPTTVITVDGGEVIPSVELTYTADTKNYIDQKIAAIGKTVVETQKALL